MDLSCAKWWEAVCLIWPSAERRAPSAERRAPSAERRAPSAVTAPRAREQADPPMPPDRRPPRRGGGSSPSNYAASAAGRRVPPVARHGLVRSARALAAAALLALSGALALPPSAQAQTAIALVSNIGQGVTGQTSVTSRSISQRFDTGDNGNGYTLTGVDLVSDSSDAFAAQVCETDSSGHPTSTCWALEPPGTFVDGTVSFAAPAGTPLTITKETTYAVVVTRSGSGGEVRYTDSDSENPGKAAEWSIADVFERLNIDLDAYVPHSGGDALQIAIKGTITPTPPTVSVGDAAATEGNAVVFPVTLSAAAAESVTVNWRATIESGDTAVLADLGEPRAGAVTIPSGSTTGGTFRVPTVQDAADEPNETFTVTLSGVSSNATLGTATAKGTITDDDGTPAYCTLNTGDVWCGVLTRGAEVDGSSEYYGYVATTESFPGGTLDPSTFTYADVSYTVDRLYVSTGISKAAIFETSPALPNDADLVLQLPTFRTAVSGSCLVGGTEDFDLDADSAHASITERYQWNAQFSGSCLTADDWARNLSTTGTVKLIGRAATPSTGATLSALSLGTGDLGTGNLILPGTGVVFDQPFASGTTAYTATVGNDENDVQVLATASDADATIEYLDASDTELSDPNDVDLSVGSNNVIKVKVTAEDGMTTLTYTVTVTRVADVALTPPSDALVSTLGRGTGTEGHFVAVSQAFTTGSNASGYTLTGVDVASASSTGFTAQVCETDSGGDCTPLTAPVDSGAFPVGAVSFTAPANTVLMKETTYAVVVTATGAANTQGWGHTTGGNNAESDDEDAGSADGWSVANGSRHRLRHQTTLRTSSSRSLRMAIRGSAGGGTPPPLPTLSIKGKAVGSEGDGVEFTATLSAAATGDVTATWTASIGTSDSATAADLATTKTGPVTVEAGDTMAKFTVPTAEDTADEENETFTVTLSGVSTNAQLAADPTAEGVIEDDDDLPELSIANASKSEEHGFITFRVTLSPASGKTVTVTYVASVETGDTATSLADFEAGTDTLTFNPGNTGVSFTLRTTDDSLDEDDETFTVTLSNPANATISDGEAKSTITDDDPTPTVTVAGATATEGDKVEFVVTLSAVSGRDVEVDYATSVATGDDATSGTDFTSASGTLTIAAADNTATGTIEVQTTEDNDSESAETFTLTLSNPDNATLGTPSAAKGTIDNRATAPTITDVAVTSTPVLATDTYGAGEEILFTVTFSGAVDVTGDPELAFSLDSGEDRAPYKSGTGTDELVFAYTVASGDEDDDGIFLLDGSDFNNRVGPVTLDSDDAIKATGSTTDADLAHIGRGTQSGHKVDGSRSIVSVAVSSTPMLETDTYGAGETIRFTVTFSAAVNIGGSPVFRFSLGNLGIGRQVDAAYESGAGSAALVFGYTVVSSDEDDDGIWIGHQGQTLVGTHQTGTITIVATSEAAGIEHAALGVLSGHKVDGSRTTGNNAPVFTSSASLSVEENTTNATVVAVDNDTDDDITGYAITGGTDQAFFDNVTTAGQLWFKDPPNFEDPKDSGTDNTYVVTVEATSGTGTREMTATQTITVTVTDADEKSAKPDKPTLAKVTGSSTTLTATWTKPGLNGGPDITGYAVQYKVNTATTWEDFAHTGTAVTTTVTGLTADTSYQVQVRAKNGETDSDWSDASDAVSTNAAMTPATCTLNTGDVWCAVLTVGSNSAGSRNGYHSGQYGQLSDTKFDLSSTEYTVESIRWVTATGQSKDLILDLDGLPAEDVWRTWHLQVDANKFSTTNVEPLGTDDQLRFENAYEARPYPALNTAVTVRLTTSSTGALEVNAQLSALTVKDGNADLTLSPAFDQGTYAYTTSAASDVETVTFTATAIDRGSVRYQVGTTTLVDADATAPGFQVTLDAGANTIDVIVVSEDGGISDFYRVTVTRAGALATPTSFTATVGDTQVTLAWDAPGSGATGHEYRFVTFPIGSSYDEGYTLFGPWTQIPDSGVGGANEAGFTVTGLTNEVVHIFQVRAASTGGYSAPATSAEVTPRVADDFPADTTTSGVVAVGGSATGVIESALDLDWFRVMLAAGKTYQIDMEGSETGRGDLDDPLLWAIHDGVGALVLDLTLDSGIDDGGQGFNSRATFTPSAAGAYYVAVAGRGSSTGGYTLFVREVMPADATLSALMVNDGSSDLTLTPAFASGTYAYAASVANAVDEVTVTPTTNQTAATFAWLDADDNALDDADTSTGHQVALAVGDTVFKVKVTGGDGTSTQTYTVTVTRAAATPGTMPTLSIADAEGAEGDGVEFTVTLTATSTTDVTATWTASIETGDTASTADLATTKTGTVTVDDGETTAKFTVPVNDDNIYEDDETFTVTLSGVSTNAQLAADPTATGTIDDNENPPKVSFEQASYTAAEGGSEVEVVVTLTSALPNNIFVTVTAEHGAGATAGDYQGIGTRAVFLAGFTRFVFTVTATDDMLDEADETVTLGFTIPSSAPDVTKGSVPEATLTLTDNDERPTVTVADAAATEGDKVEFVVTLSAVSGRDVTVDYATSVATGDDATSGTDFTAASATLTIAAADNTATGTIEVQTTEDDASESAETFTLTISSPTNATLTTDTTATGTINNRASTDATLSGLALNDGSSDLTLSPAFASGTIFYTASVDHDVDEVTVTATATHANATFEYLDLNEALLADANATDDGFQVALPIGNTEIRVKVTAEDDTTTGLYVVTVTRPLEALTPPADALVSSIGQGIGYVNSRKAIAQSFTTGSNASGYTLSGVDVASASSTAFTAQVCGADTNGVPTSTCTNLTAPDSFALGAVSFTAPANTVLVKDTTYAVVVTADGNTQGWGSTSKNDEDAGKADGWSIRNDSYFRYYYNAPITWNSEPDALRMAVRGSAVGGTLSTDATLSALSVTADSSLMTFVSGTTSYTTSVNHNVDEVNVAATTNDSNATFEIQDASDMTLADADSSANGFQVTLAAGATVIKVKVTAEDGTTTQTYTVTVTQAVITPVTPPADALVSNVGQSSNSNEYFFEAIAQGFTTGSNASGYTLTGVDVLSASTTGFTAQVCGTGSSGLPTSTCTALTAPGSIAVGTNAFTAPANTTLTKDTTYAVVVTADGATQGWGDTSADGEDAGKADGWSIGDEYVYKPQAADTLWTTGAGSALRMAVRGSAVGGTPTNNAPVFTSSASLSVEENTTNATVVAVDNDTDDDITGYAITGGADQALFSIGVTSGALTFKTAPNFEDAKDSDTDNDYVVTVEATSGTGTREMTATQTITVTVTDVNEKSAKPDKPTLAAVTGSTTTLTATWTKPDLDGGPDIIGYDVGYKVSTANSWTSFTHTGTGVTATITGLTASTSYQVRVLAKNGETDSDWSDASTAVSTNAAGTTPTITAVASTSTPVLETDTYGQGERIEVTVTFSEAVNATTDTDFVLSVGGDDTRAPVLDGSGTTRLVFSYTVRASDEDDNGIWIGDQDRTLVGDRMGLPQAGAITSVATSTAADLSHSGLGTDADHKVDGSRSIVLVAVSSTPMLETDTYGAGETIRFKVTFSSGVSIGGSPVFRFSLGNLGLGRQVDAAYESGAGSAALVFGYTVVSSDEDDDGIWIGHQGQTLVGTHQTGTITIVATSEAAAGIEHDALGVLSGHKVDGSRTTGNNAPVFTSSASLSVEENTTNATVVAVDNDTDDDITGYAITGGTDLAFFSEITSAGVLSFNEAPNFEDPKDSGTDNTYVVTVEATSGTGTREMTATQTITVTVTDADEKSAKPDKPTLAKVTGSSTTLTATWTKPGLNGGPDITGYAVQYKVNTATTWEDFVHTGTAVTTTVTGLTADTSYQVQVRAKNGETDSDWSDPSDAVKTNAEMTTGCTLNTGDLWCGVATVEELVFEGTSFAYGFVDASASPNPSDTGALSDKEFTVGTNRYTIDIATVGLGATAEGLNFSLTSALSDTDKEKLVLHVGSRTFAFSDATRTNDGFTYQWSNTGLDWSSETSVTLRLRAPNNAPEFATDIAILTVPENSAADTVVGTVTATDDDSDTLTYSLEGTDAASFAIDSGTGEIKTKAGVTYNYEAKFDYEMTAKADDGNGGTDTIDVAIALLDDDTEKSAKPAKPTLAPVPGSSTSLAASWRKPGLNGGPDITGYKLEYRERPSGDWEDFAHGGTAETTTITGLMAGTEYQVRVQAENGEGDSDWSDPSDAVRTNAVDIPIPPGLEVTLHLSDDALLEDDERATLVTATVSPASPVPFTVTISATPVAPATGDDFELSNNRVLRFAAAATESTGTVTIRPVTDDDPEPHDVVTVSGAVSNAAIPDPDDVALTIRNDDVDLPQDVAIDAPAAVEEDAGTAAVTVTITTRQNSAPTIDVDLHYRWQEGTATRGEDYTAPPGQVFTNGVLFATVSASAFSPNAAGTAWVAERSFTIGIVNDQEAEGDETIAFHVTTGTYRSPEQTITLRDDDTPVMRNVTLVSGPGSDGEWRTGERVDVEVRYSLPVVVERPDCWLLNADGTCRPPGPYMLVAFRSDARPGYGEGLSAPLAPYDGGSGTDTLRFAYTVGAAEDGARRVAVGGSNGIFLRGATIRPLGGGDAELSEYTLTRVMQVTVRKPGRREWTAGDTVRVAVRFAGPVQYTPPDEPQNRDEVFVDERRGTPTIRLLLGDHERRGLRRTARYERGSGTDTLTFEYAVRSGDGRVSAVEVVADSLARNGATIRNEDGYDVELHHVDVLWYSPLALLVRDAAAREGGTLKFAMELARASQAPVTVDYETADGTATAGEDYTAKRGTVTFAPGRTRRTVAVPVLRDGEAEDAETVVLRLSNARSAGSRAPVEVTVAQAEGTIEDVAPEAPSGGLTARFARAPAEHDGRAFTLRIAFSETIRMSGRRLRSDVVSVAGGRATKAGPVNGRKDMWKLTVRPASLADVTVTLAAGAACDTPAAVCTADGKALSHTLSTTVRGPVTVSVADARAREGEDETIDFAVSLSRAASGRVSVTWATADGSARSGSDYTARKGKLRFAPGETEKTVSVPVLDDAHDEGAETFTLRLTAASGAVIADGVATGTIENTDHMPAAWLARFGRTVTDQVLGAVEARLAASRAAGTRVRLVGQALPFWDADGDRAKTAANDDAGAGASGRALRADARGRALRAGTGPGAPGRCAGRCSGPMRGAGRR